jgi:hypothetical protein
MRAPLTLFIIVAFAFPATALAKGPDYAMLSGPGINGSIRIDGDAEGGTGTPLGALTTFGGFFPQAFGHHPNDPTTMIRPAGKLGTRYRVVYSVPGPGGRKPIVADVYPSASPRAVTYMQPGQPFLNGMRTHGGWYVARPGLRRTLEQAGLTRAASGGDTHTWRWLGIGALALAALAAATALLLRRRPQSTPAPAA